MRATAQNTAHGNEQCQEARISFIAQPPQAPVSRASQACGALAAQDTAVGAAGGRGVGDGYTKPGIVQPSQVIALVGS